MAWRNLIEADLLKKISGAEIEGFRSAALATGQADPIDDQIAQTVDMVRGYISAGGNELGDADTLPERLIGPACDVIILDVMSRAAGIAIDPEDVRSANARRATKLFEQVAAGKYAIDDPATGDEQSQGGATRVTTNTPRVNRTNLGGF
jgi:hypothetical protein